MTQLSASIGTALRVIRRFAGPLQDHDVPGDLKLLEGGCYAVHQDYFFVIIAGRRQEFRKGWGTLGPT